MSAHSVGTGKRAHPWADALATFAANLDEPVEIRLPHEPEPYQRRLIEVLGGRIVIDPQAPAFVRPTGCHRQGRR